MTSQLPSIKIGWTQVVEAQRGVVELGGGLRPETHRGEAIEDYNNTAARGGRTCGCGLPARATVPYLRVDGKPGFANICQVCDAGPRMPRIALATRAARERAEVEPTTQEAPDGPS